MQQIKRPYEGFFLTIEGGDGCGKTVLAARLMHFLQGKGYTVVKTREPGGTPLSEHIRDLLLRPNAFRISERAEMLLYLAARAQQLEEVILPALHAGHLVLCERFNDSTVVYQGCARHLGIDDVTRMCHLACGGVEPDCTLFLDLDPAIGLSRIKGSKDRLEQEKLQFHTEVRQGYLHLADQYPERIVIVDAAASEEEVFTAAAKALELHLLLKPWIKT